jgi:ABC-type arginine transport system ATPase subunit
LRPWHCSRHAHAAPGDVSRGQQDFRACAPCHSLESDRNKSPIIKRIVHDIKQRGITTIIVEQNVVAALEPANRALILEMGHIVFNGSAKEVLEFRYEGEGCRQSVGARRDHP